MSGQPIDAERRAELLAVAEAARLWFPADNHDGMDETPWMDEWWWRAAGLDDRHAKFAATFDPPTVLALLATVAAQAEQLAAVEALADEWEHEYPTLGILFPRQLRANRRGFATGLAAAARVMPTEGTELIGEGPLGGGIMEIAVRLRNSQTTNYPALREMANELEQIAARLDSA